MVTEMIKEKLGTLEAVDVHKVRESEPTDFTPWLAEEANIALLGEALGIELEVEEQEKSVGPFRADILCKDTSEDRYVVIENQLEKTDHTHLGQVITYASGLDASTIVWIARKFTEQHRAAVDWLNKATDEDVQFFAIEIELWRIGNSELAPKFNVISKPNIVTKRTTGLTPVRQMQLEYWTGLRELLDSTKPIMKSATPRPKTWLGFAIGRSGFTTHAAINSGKKFIGVGLTTFGQDGLSHFKLLEQDRESIETDFGDPLLWHELPGKKKCRIVIRKSEVDPTNRKQWVEQHQWMKEKLERFQSVFRQRIQELDADDYNPDDDGTI